MDCTLKVNMILEDGKHYDRGTVLPIEKLPNHLRTDEYIVKGAVSINRVMPIDMVEVGQDIEETSADEQASPMKELTLSELQPPAITRRKPVRRR